MGLCEVTKEPLSRILSTDVIIFPRMSDMVMAVSELHAIVSILSTLAPEFAEFGKKTSPSGDIYSLLPGLAGRGMAGIQTSVRLIAAATSVIIQP